MRDQDPKIVRFNDACRNDQPDSMEYRHNYLRKYIMTSVIDLEQRNLDPQRNFAEAQRLAIWNRGDKKMCSLFNRSRTQTTGMQIILLLILETEEQL